MRQFRTIEIDFDVHKTIENARRGFYESPNGALRRLLKLPEPDPSPRTADATPRLNVPGGITAWTFRTARPFAWSTTGAFTKDGSWTASG